MILAPGYCNKSGSGGLRGGIFISNLASRQLMTSQCFWRILFVLIFWQCHKKLNCIPEGKNTVNFYFSFLKCINWNKGGKEVLHISLSVLMNYSSFGPGARDA